MAHGFSGSVNDAAMIAFHERHRDVVGITSPHLGKSDDDKLERWTIYQHYANGLVLHGLLADEEGMITPGKARRVRITDLGHRLLSAISCNFS
jgi:hypothetical protein